MRAALIVGARPNFMKAAPVLEELRRRHGQDAVRLVHTGQHYDEKMSDLFFEQLGMPRPDTNLGVGSGSHAVQTARIMVALEELFLAERPALLVVFGDVNSTVAAALVAAKLRIPLAHVEAGLRSFDRDMPEEVNRIVTDALSDALFATEAAGVHNLAAEGVPADRVHLVGNTMIDTLVRHRPRAEALGMPDRMGLTPGRYAVVTLHRPSNVDDPAVLSRIATALAELSADIPVVFPMHPRTAERLGAWTASHPAPRLHLVEPLGYLEFVGLMAAAGVILTDSGGIQEEAAVLRVPCVTLRANTERPVTVECGGNVLVGQDTGTMLREARRSLARDGRPAPTIPPLWDGQAAGRIVDVLERPLRKR